jgi:hypothetical protein
VLLVGDLVAAVLPNTCLISGVYGSAPNLFFPLNVMGESPFRRGAAGALAQKLTQQGKT